MSKLKTVIKMALATLTLGGAVLGGMQLYENTRPIKVEYFGEIQPDTQYYRLLNILRNAHYGQRVDIYMLSPGGYVIQGNELAKAMQDSHGTVVYHVGSFAASMAAVLICSADKVDIADSATVMYHTVQTPDGPIINPNPNSIDGALLNAAKVLTSRCKFLTSDDHKKIWSGGEVWLTGSEINKRLGGH